MLGFIKKELLMIKSNFKSTGIVLIIYIIIGLINKMDVSFILPFISVVLMISTFSYDTINSWDVYAITLPNGRKNLVRAKYIATILIVLLFSLVSIPFSIYLSLPKINMLQIFSSLIGTIFGTLLVMSFMYPIIYKFGIEKARIVIFILIFGIFIAGGYLLKYLDFSFLANFIDIIANYIIVILLLLLVLLLVISYVISIKIVSKKEY